MHTYLHALENETNIVLAISTISDRADRYRGPIVVDLHLKGNPTQSAFFQKEIEEREERKKEEQQI